MTSPHENVEAVGMEKSSCIEIVNRISPKVELDLNAVKANPIAWPQSFSDVHANGYGELHHGCSTSASLELLCPLTD